MILKGKRVTLRPIVEFDFDHYYKWHSDNDIRFQTIMHPFPVTEKLEKEWFEKAITDISNKRFIFTIVENETQNAIGYFQLTNINFIDRNANLGIVIGEKNYQGKGLGKEIMELGIGYGFNFIGLHKISLDVLSDNEMAIKLYKRIGFVDEGFFVNHFFFQGIWHSIKRMAIFNNLKNIRNGQ